MRQLTHAEKQHLGAKIKDEQERQQALREMYPNTPEDSKMTFFRKNLVSLHDFLT